MGRCGRAGSARRGRYTDDDDAVPADAADGLWPQLAKFNRYSFCKSHAVSYGLIAWAAAHLKVHHPLAFWTAALNNTQGSYPRRVYVEAVKRAGRKPVSRLINTHWHFDHAGGNEVFGRAAVAQRDQQSSELVG